MMDLSSANDFCIVFGICDYFGKINEIDCDESRRHTASVVLAPRVSENVTQPRPRPYATERVSSCAPMAEGNHLARASPLDYTWHAYSARSTAQGNLLLFPNQQTRKMVVERANKTTDKELVRLCLQLKQKSCGSGNYFKQGLYETALDYSAYLAEADKPTSVEGGRILQRTNPRSRSGPITEIHILNKEALAQM